MKGHAKDDLCYIACRDAGNEAIELGGEKLPMINEEKCLSYGLCKAVCPVWGCVVLKEVEMK